MENGSCLGRALFTPGAEVRLSHLEHCQFLGHHLTPLRLVWRVGVSWESPDICLLSNYGAQPSNLSPSSNCYKTDLYIHSLFPSDSLTPLYKFEDKYNICIGRRHKPVL